MRYQFLTLCFLLLAGPAWAVDYKYNFEISSTTTPAGYTKDYGVSSGSGGLWSTDMTGSAFERSVNSNKRADTGIRHSNTVAAAVWTLPVANGIYDVTVGAGDPSNTALTTVSINGTQFQNALSSGVNAFNAVSRRLTVSGGAITLTLGGAGGSGSSAINFIDVIGATAGTYKYNFEVVLTATPAGYVKDYGLIGTSGGLWSVNLIGNGRERNSASAPANADKRLDTLVFHANASAAATWSLPVENGTYDVTVSCGDVSGAMTNSVVVEGVQFHNATNTALNTFTSITHEVAVSDGVLTLVFGGTTGSWPNGSINYIDVIAAEVTTTDAPRRKPVQW